MERPSNRPPGDAGPRHLLWLGLAVALAAIAFRALLWRAVEAPGAGDVERWLFRPSRQPTILILGLSAWMLWRRRDRLAPRADVAGAPGLALALGALSALVYVWAELADTLDLMLPALAGVVLAVAAMLRGAAGVRSAALPAALLLLGMAIPSPLEAEIVWWLQRASAAGAAWMLEATGHEIVHAGVLLHTEYGWFHVIDACSGLAGITILFLTSLVVRELFAGAGPRLLLVVAASLPLGLVLNMVRIAYVALTPDGAEIVASQGGHMSQGIAVLVAGSAILYGSALALSGFRVPPVARSTPSPRTADWRPLAAGLGGLALLSFAVSPFELPLSAYTRAPLVFPTERGAWTSEPREVNPAFVGPLPSGDRIERRYQLAGGGPGPEIEMFIGRELSQFAFSSRLLSSKLHQPGPDWRIESIEPTRIWSIDRDATLTVSQRPGERPRAVAYTWREGDRGLAIESLHALLGLDQTPWRRERPRGVVQIVAFARGPAVLHVDNAKQQLNDFATTFREAFDAL